MQRWVIFIHASSLLEIQCISWLPMRRSGPRCSAGIVEMRVPEGFRIDFSVVEEGRRILSVRRADSSSFISQSRTRVKFNRVFFLR